MALDPVTTHRGHYRVIFDNDRRRALRLSGRPGVDRDFVESVIYRA
jgi:hypothetical protein